MAMTTNMNGVYTKNRAVARGRDKGTYIVYHIYIPSKHRGIHQGYIGRSQLTLEGVKWRYRYEVTEASSDKYVRKLRYVHEQILLHRHEVKIVALATGLTLEEAKEMEAQLRPKKGVWKNKFTWNISAGG